jgi:hypothetical protein
VTSQTIVPFHVAIHGRSQAATPGPRTNVWGKSVVALASPAPLGQTPLPVTFEEAEAAFTKIPRLYFEPDGSFGWFAAPDQARWEIGGMLYDRGDRLMYAELNGACPAAEFRRLLDALGCSREPLVVQLIERAIFLDAEEFCLLLASVSP